MDAAWLIHYHDAAHYYLGAKYFRELGYAGLYKALCAAYAEKFPGQPLNVDVRGLDDYSLMTFAEARQAGDKLKNNFTASRWEDFKKDTQLFIDGLGPVFPSFLYEITAIIPRPSSPLSGAPWPG